MGRSTRTLLLLSCCVVARPGAAVTKTWVGGDAVLPRCWCKAANWLPAGVPAATDDVVIDNGTWPLQLTYDVECASLTLRDSGRLEIGPHTLRCGSFDSSTGNVSSAGLIMVDTNGELIVDGPCRFAVQNDAPNADSTGHLTAGTLRARGDFEVRLGTHPTNVLGFVSTGTKVVFDGSAPQLVSMFIDPNETAHSQFAAVEIANPAGVTFLGPDQQCRAVVTDQLTMGGAGVALGDAIFCTDELPAATAGYQVLETRWTGRLGLTAPTTINLGGSTLVMEPGAAIDLNGHSLTFNGDLRLGSLAAGDGLLMLESSDQATINGELDYGNVGVTDLAGGGMFDAGTLHLRGDVRLTTVGQPWQIVDLSAGTRVLLDGNAPQTLRCPDPVGNRPAFGWPQVELRNPTALRLEAQARFMVQGLFRVPAGITPTIQGVEGYDRLPSFRGVDVDGLVFDNCDAHVGSLQGEQEAEIVRFDNVTFQNLSGGRSVILTVNHQSQQAPLIFRNLRFLSLPPDDGGSPGDYLWLRANTFAGDPTVTLILQNPTPADPDGRFDDAPSDRITIVWGAPAANHPPDAPTLLSPASGSALSTLPLVLTLRGSDPDDAAALQYQVQLAEASSGTVVATYSQPDSQEGWDQPAYDEGETATLAVSDAPTDGSYTWRARAYDGFEWGAWSAASPFTLATPMRLDSVVFDRATTLWDTVTATITGRGLSADSMVELVIPASAARRKTRIAASTVTAGRQADALEATFPTFGAVTRRTATQVVVTATDERSATVAAPALEPVEFAAGLATPGRDGRLGVWDSWNVTFGNGHDFFESPRITLNLDLLTAGGAPAAGWHYEYQIVDSSGQPAASGTWSADDPLPAVSLPPVPAGGRAGYSIRLRVAPDAQGRAQSRVEPVTIIVVGGIIVVGALIYDGMLVGDMLREDNVNRTLERRMHEALLFHNQLDFEEEPYYYGALCQRLSHEVKDLYGRSDATSIEANAEEYARSFSSDVLYQGYDEADMQAVKLAILEGWQGKRNHQQVLHAILQRNNAVGSAQKSKVILEAFYDAALDLDANPSRKVLPVSQTFTYSWDPNAKGGTVGVDGYIRGDEPIQYVVSFENDPELATAAAQVVQVDDVLPAGLDLSTLTFDSVQVGSQLVTLPAGTTELDERIDLRPEQNAIVEVKSTLDVDARALRVTFRGLDPSTGELAADGFLPPNQTSPEGEGYLAFTVSPVAGLADGTVIRNQAVITFDPHAGVNEPITTEAHTLTIDTAAPSASLGDLPAEAGVPYFALPLSAEDSGVGLAFCEVWVARDDGPYELWQRVEPAGRAPVASRGLFGGAYSSTYRFRVIAEDRLGNRLDPGAQPTATVRTGTPPVINAGLQLVSVPLDTGGADPQAVFGFAGNRWAYWCPKCVEYAVHPDARANPLNPTRGYWVQLDQAVTPNVDGAAAKPSEPPLLPLFEGWNAIAVPWTFAVRWSLDDIQVVADEPGDGPDQLSLAEAAEAGWIEPYAWSWRADETAFGGHYQLIYDADLLPEVTESLSPWQGYWVLAHRACRLILPPPDPEAVPERARRASAGAWSLRLLATDGLGASEVTLGVVRGKAARFGRPPDPPAAAAGPRLTVAGGGVPAAVDLHTAGGRQEWTLLVSRPAESRSAAEVTLTWPSLRAVPSDVRLTLVDQQTGTRRALRSTAAYRYVPAAGEMSRTFTLVAERGGTSLQVLGLTCQPTRGGGLEVSFELSAPAETQIRLVSPSGRAVAVLDGGTARSAGRARAAADLRDAAGRRLPRGLYQVQVVAIDEEGRQARAVQPVLLR